MVKIQTSVRVFFFFLLGGVGGSLWAQAPYRGGAGDGYDQAKLTLQASNRPAEEPAFSLVPQPLPQGQLLQVELPTEGLVRWTLYDLQGKVVMSWPVPQVAQARYQLRLGTLPPGPYQLTGVGLPHQFRQLLILVP